MIKYLITANCAEVNRILLLSTSAIEFIYFDTINGNYRHLIGPEFTLMILLFVYKD